ncbi:hypothetical protein ABEV74_22075 [Paenibacillus cisolokensis]
MATIVPIHADGNGKDYKFSGNFFLYPLALTDDEAVGLTVVSSIIDEDKLPQGFASAYDKIMATHNPG